MRPLFRRTLGDENDKIVFGIASFGGIFLIILIRVIGDAIVKTSDYKISFWDYLAVITAVGIILGYTVYIILTKNRTSISVDRASDNSYYLGLLFTLTSLAYSLIKLSTVEINVLYLLPDFGVALFSTIAGLFARIFLQQMRNDPQDIETEAREELGLAIRSLRESIGSVVSQLNGVKEQTSVSILELSNTIKQNQLQLEEELADAQKRSANKNAEAIDEVTKNFQNVGNNIQTQAGQITNFSSNMISEFTAVMSSLEEKLTKLGNAPEELSNRLGSLARDFENISTSIEKTTQNQSNLSNELSSAMTNLNQIFSEGSFSRIGRLSDLASQRLESLASTTEANLQNISDLNERLRKTAERITDVVQQDILRVKKKSDALHESIENLDEVSSDYIKQVTQATSLLRDKTNIK